MNAETLFPDTLYRLLTLLIPNSQNDSKGIKDLGHPMKVDGVSRLCETYKTIAPTTLRSIEKLNKIPCKLSEL